MWGKLLSVQRNLRGDWEVKTACPTGDMDRVDQGGDRRAEGDVKTLEHEEDVSSCFQDPLQRLLGPVS